MKKKIFTLIALFAISMLGLVALSWYGQTKLDHLEHEVHERGSAAVKVTAASFIGTQMYQIVADSIINRNLDESAKDWAEGKAQANAQLAEVEQLVDTEEEQALVRVARQAYSDFVDVYEKEMLPILRVGQGDAAAISAVDDRLDAEVAKIAENMGKIKVALDEEAVVAQNEFDVTGKATLIELLVAGGGYLPSLCLSA